MKKSILSTALIVSALFTAHGQAHRQFQGIGSKPSRSLQKGVATNGTSTNMITPAFAVPVRRTCGTMELLQEQQAQGLMPSDAEFENWISEKQASMRAARQAQGVLSPNAPAAVIQIPVIVHVIHNGEAIGVGANISAAQVNSQIEVLNDDFRKKINTPGYNTHPAGADMEIEFVPAQVDLSGNPLAEPGIHRYAGTASSYSQTTFNSTIKPATSWDPTKYANLWTANLSGGILGYAQFPSNSTLTGLNTNGGASNTDGVVIGYQYFGSIAKVTTSQLSQGAPYNRGRTLTHELGHWLGLRHIWGDASCGTDYCNDTPTHAEANYSPTNNPNGCFTHPKSNSCGTADEMFENYMDYTNDVCMNIFTNDQKGRMAAVIANSPRRAELLTSTVGNAPITCAATPNLLPLAQDFEAGFLPTGWTIRNAGGDSTWHKANVSANGIGTGAVVMNNFTTNAAGALDFLMTPQHNFTAVTGAVLKFDVAYSPFSATSTDSLFLAYSVDCGNTFQTFWKKGGSALSTTGSAYSTSAFTPTATQWRTETVNLATVGSQIFGAGKDHVVIAFQNKSGYGNYLYLDNIQITTGSPVAAVPVADFVSSVDGGCAGTSVTFTNQSTNTPTSYAWTFEGGTPATSTAANPTVTYSTPGSYNVSLVATNSAGADTTVKSDFIFIGNATAQILPLTTTFETTDADSVAWSVINPNSDTTWVLVNTGSNGSATSAMMDNYSSASVYGTADVLLSPKMKFTATTQKLSFDVAYGFYGTDSTQTPPIVMADTIIVLASTDCGNTFKRIWAKGGAELATVTGLVKTAFTPTSSTQWRREGISLAAFKNLANVQFAIMNKSGYGNRVFLDSITIAAQTTCPTAPTITSTTTNICEGSAITMTVPNFAGTTYKWTGPNGFTSTVRNPSILAATPANSGTYYVTATVAGCTSVPSVITVNVNPKPAAPVATVSAATLCSNDTIRLHASTVADAAYYWTGPNNFTSNVQNPVLANPTSAMVGTYSVYAIARGCTSAVATAMVTSVVTGPTTIAVTGSASICAGLNLSLAATNVTGATYAWTGPNGYTAATRTISITAATVAASGTYTVVATKNGCASNTVTTTVTVKPAPNMPTVSLVNDSLISDTVAATYQWYKNTTPITGATSRKYKPTVSGNYAVRIGNAQPCYATSTLFAYTLVGVGSQILNQAVSLFPSPSTGLFHLNIEDDRNADIKINVFDILGKEVANVAARKSDALFEQTLDLQHLPDGTYFVKIQEGNLITTRRIVKAAK
ncbi:Por secretion system C-terminal sorting domain-containing protein [Flexibacter flexilis DSM 6793]|uniref:Por secretion system C-terminal sorting domain-containing protein n=2 Tax=Flexibacter flexilis TaxID=998 RepID=A0A1I1H4M3_9BACT|nr:Por secretion system C-terminal sorting domain-containing protein [Flexibacter flexilis DSM 6793]